MKKVYEKATIPILKYREALVKKIRSNLREFGLMKRIPKSSFMDIKHLDNEVKLCDIRINLIGIVNEFIITLAVNLKMNTNLDARKIIQSFHEHIWMHIKEVKEKYVDNREKWYD